METKTLSATSSGWIFALSDQSNWGSPNELIEDLGLKNIRKSSIEVETKAWGKIPKDKVVLPGMGLAFYHTQRAFYGEGDPHKRKPRITMVGVLKDFEVLDETGDMEYRLVLSFEKDVVDHLIKNPIVRNEDTKQIFEKCGMVQGNVRTWYEANPAAWKEIIAKCTP